MSRGRVKFQPSPSNFYTTIKQSCILFDGLIQNTLPRDEVYHFLRFGRNLERVNVMGRILHAKCQSLPGSEGGLKRGWSWSDGPDCSGAVRHTGRISTPNATESSRSA